MCRCMSAVPRTDSGRAAPVHVDGRIVGGCRAACVLRQRVFALGAPSCASACAGRLPTCLPKATLQARGAPWSPRSQASRIDRWRSRSCGRHRRRLRESPGARGHRGRHPGYRRGALRRHRGASPGRGRTRARPGSRYFGAHASRASCISAASDARPHRYSREQRRDHGPPSVSRHDRGAVGEKSCGST